MKRRTAVKREMGMYQFDKNTPFGKICTLAKWTVISVLIGLVTDWLELFSAQCYGYPRISE